MKNPSIVGISLLQHEDLSAEHYCRKTGKIRTRQEIRALAAKAASDTAMMLIRMVREASAYKV